MQSPGAEAVGCWRVLELQDAEPRGRSQPRLPTAAPPRTPAGITHAFPAPQLSAMWQEFKRVEPSSLWKYLIKIPSLPLFLGPDRMWVWGRGLGEPPELPHQSPAAAPRLSLGLGPLGQPGSSAPSRG